MSNGDIVQEGAAGGSRLFDRRFTARVTYVQPVLDQLRRRFYLNIIEFRDRKFKPLDSCRKELELSALDSDVRNCEVPFEYIRFGRKVKTDEVLEEMGSRGLRPALLEELLGFAERYPDEQRKHPIAALGSQAEDDGRRDFAYLWVDYNVSLRTHVPHLGLHRMDYEWPDDTMFLAVPKS